MYTDGKGVTKDGVCTQVFHMLPVQEAKLCLQRRTGAGNLLRPSVTIRIPTLLQLQGVAGKQVDMVLEGRAFLYQCTV